MGRYRLSVHKVLIRGAFDKAPLIDLELKSGNAWVQNGFCLRIEGCEGYSNVEVVVFVREDEVLIKLVLGEGRENVEIFLVDQNVSFLEGVGDDNCENDQRAEGAHPCPDIPSPTLKTHCECLLELIHAQYLGAS